MSGSTGVEVSVVVPALNAERTIGACVRALLDQDHPPERYEVIVVDNGSRDRTVQLLSGHPVTVLEEARRGPAAARNRGIRASRGHLIAFVDADCVPTRGWLRHLVKAFRDDEVTCVAGTSLPLDPSSPIGAYAARTGQYDSRRSLAHPHFPFAYSFNMALRARVLAAAGSFDPRFRTYEAADLFHRIVRQGLLEWRIETRAVVFFRTRETIGAFVRQNVAYGRGYAMFLHEHRHDVEAAGRGVLPVQGGLGEFARRVLRSRNGDSDVFCDLELIGLHLVRRAAQRTGRWWFRMSVAARRRSPGPGPARKASVMGRVALLVLALPLVMARPLPRALAILSRLNRAGLRARPEEEALVVRCIRLVARLDRWSFRNNCAVFALVLFGLLDTDEAPLEIRFGLRFAGRAPGRRHVWVVREGRALHETEPVEDYLVVYRYVSPRTATPIHASAGAPGEEAASSAAPESLPAVPR